jgi:hypothetical protein
MSNTIIKATFTSAKRGTASWIFSLFSINHCVVDPQHFDADADTDADPVSDFYFMWIRIRIRVFI